VLKIEAVRRHPLTSKATDDKVEKEVKEWLKFAAERDGKRRQRDLMNRSATKRKSVNRRRSSDREHSVESGSSAAGSSRESCTRKKLSTSSASQTQMSESSATRSQHRDLRNKAATKGKSVNRRRSSDREHSVESGSAAAGPSHESCTRKKLSIPLTSASPLLSASKPPLYDSLATHSPNRESSVSQSITTQPAPDLTN